MRRPTGNKAILLVRELQPDLLLLDLAMPGGPDGLQVTAQLRQDGYITPIVVISMYDEDARRL